MSEYCKKCSEEILGFKEYDKAPLLCEGCGVYFPKVSILQKIKTWVSSC